MELQNWIQDKFRFLKSHIRSKGLTRSSRFKSQAPGASASGTIAHGIYRASTYTGIIEISMRSTDTTLQPEQVMNPTTASGSSSVNKQVMDQFTKMRTMLLSVCDALPTDLTHHSSFHQLTRQHQRPFLQPPPPHSKNISNQPGLGSQLMPNSSCSRTTAMPLIGPFQDHCCKQFQVPFPVHPNNACCKQFQGHFPVHPNQLLNSFIEVKKIFNNFGKKITPQKTLRTLETK